MIDIIINVFKQIFLSVLTLQGVPFTRINSDNRHVSLEKYYYLTLDGVHVVLSRRSINLRTAK